jgi:hypothetical protein
LLKIRRPTAPSFSASIFEVIGWSSMASEAPLQSLSALQGGEGGAHRAAMGG